MGLELSLDGVPVLVVTDDHETGKRELAEWSGVCHGMADRCAVQVSEHGACARVGVEVDSFLSGVLDGQEHGLGRGATDGVKRIEQWHSTRVGFILAAKVDIVLSEVRPNDVFFHVAELKESNGDHGLIELSLVIL
jgi:hypothetical protein